MRSPHVQDQDIPSVPNCGEACQSVGFLVRSVPERGFFGEKCARAWIFLADEGEAWIFGDKPWRSVPKRSAPERGFLFGRGRSVDFGEKRARAWIFLGEACWSVEIFRKRARAWIFGILVWGGGGGKGVAAQGAGSSPKIPSAPPFFATDAAEMVTDFGLGRPTSCPG